MRKLQNRQQLEFPKNERDASCALAGLHFDRQSPAQFFLVFESNWRISENWISYQQLHKGLHRRYDKSNCYINASCWWIMHYQNVQLSIPFAKPSPSPNKRRMKPTIFFQLKRNKHKFQCQAASQDRGISTVPIPITYILVTTTGHNNHPSSDKKQMNTPQPNLADLAGVNHHIHCLSHSSIRTHPNNLYQCHPPWWSQPNTKLLCSFQSTPDIHTTTTTTTTHHHWTSQKNPPPVVPELADVNYHIASAIVPSTHHHQQQQLPVQAVLHADGENNTSMQRCHRNRTRSINMPKLSTRDFIANNTSIFPDKRSTEQFSIKYKHNPTPTPTKKSINRRVFNVDFYIPPFQ